jgi:hypothetical protein
MLLATALHNLSATLTDMAARSSPALPAFAAGPSVTIGSARRKTSFTVGSELADSGMRARAAAMHEEAVQLFAQAGADGGSSIMELKAIK